MPREIYYLIQSICSSLCFLYLSDRYHLLEVRNILYGFIENAFCVFDLALIPLFYSYYSFHSVPFFCSRHLTFSFTKFSISSILTQIPDILSCIFINIRWGLFLKFLFVFLNLSFPDIPHFSFYLLIQLRSWTVFFFISIYNLFAF